MYFSGPNMTGVRVAYNYLGRSGLKVSNICLGTGQFGDRDDTKPQSSTAEAHAVLDRFVELGGNFIDTADSYQKGRAEMVIGSWLKNRQDRDRLVIASKLCFSVDDSDPNARGLSRKHIMNSVERSLKNLQTDYLDLYQIHGWDKGTPLEETLRTLNDLVRCGKVRYLGASNLAGWQLQKIMDYCKFLGLEQFVSLQAQYNLLVRSIDWEMTDLCQEEGLGMMCYSPLKGGWLSGKIRQGMTVPPGGSRVEWSQQDTTGTRKLAQSQPNWDTWASQERTWNIIDMIDNISKELGRDFCEVPLRWVLQRPAVSCIIVGPRTIKQLEENMAAATGWELNKDQMAALDTASDVLVPYPWDMMRRMQLGRERP